MVSFPYYSHTIPIRIRKDMGIVWVPLTISGVPCPWESLESPLIYNWSRGAQLVGVLNGGNKKNRVAVVTVFFFKPLVVVVGRSDVSTQSADRPLKMEPFGRSGKSQHGLKYLWFQDGSIISVRYFLENKFWHLWIKNATWPFLMQRLQLLLPPKTNIC